jgi:thiol-disulfide isomerase/thioredoxin
MFSKLKTLAAVTMLAAAAATSTAAIAGPLENSAPAPEFTGISKWLNSDPLTLQQLRGKVVLVDFWTYTCINCINTLPYVKNWNQKYKDQGLTVIGVHTPEYPFERDTDNVKTAIKRFGITFPVAQDNRYATWNAYDNQYWPAFYLIDKKGQVVYRHFGEGDYAQTEAKIQALLAQKG